MKTSYLKITTVILLLCSIWANAQTQFNADPATSTVHWKGFKPTGEHYGEVKVKSGFFTVKDQKIVEGEFQIDMNSISVLDIPSDEKSNPKLVRHLKSEDFFGVKKHPHSTWKLTSVASEGDKTLFKGDLTIKGITHPVSFTATVDYKDEQIVVKSDSFKIDRSKWDIKYKSNSFFENMGDKFIYDDIELSVHVSATK